MGIAVAPSSVVHNSPIRVCNSICVYVRSSAVLLKLQFKKKIKLHSKMKWITLAVTLHFMKNYCILIIPVSLSDDGAVN